MASLKKRSNIYYLQYSIGGTIKRVSLETPSLQIAKEKKRQFESARLQGNDNPLPTKTPLPVILERYVQHIRNHKTPKSQRI